MNDYTKYLASRVTAGGLSRREFMGQRHGGQASHSPLPTSSSPKAPKPPNRSGAAT